MTLNSYKMLEARNSAESLLPRLFAYVDYRKIGTHENPEVPKLEAVYKSILENGYHGPTVSVFYFGDDTRLQQVTPNKLVDEDYGAIGIADGHNRMEAFRLLDEQGLLRSRIIPVQIVPAHNTNIVRLNHPDPKETPIAITQVENCFNIREKIIPNCASYFEAKLKDGSWVRIRDAQPDIIISREDFLVLEAST